MKGCGGALSLAAAVLTSPLPLPFLAPDLLMVKQADNSLKLFCFPSRSRGVGRLIGARMPSAVVGGPRPPGTVDIVAPEAPPPALPLAANNRRRSTALKFRAAADVQHDPVHFASTSLFTNRLQEDVPLYVLPCPSCCSAALTRVVCLVLFLPPPSRAGRTV